LQELGCAMKNDIGEERNTVVAGYTYLGQFIDHDLTFDITPLDQAHIKTECIRNFRTPFLDLDNMYGGGPTVSPFLYDMAGKPGEERFLIGRTHEPKPGDDPENDLPRNSHGIALVPDPRQDENVIIAQFHVAMLKFHNRVMHELEKGTVASAGPVGATLFEKARRLVTWNYQYIVLNDYLAELIDLEVFGNLKPGCGSACANNPSATPIEFSAAAFRFGHSMVRDSYHYNKLHQSVKLRGDGTTPDLLTLTGIGGGTRPALPGEWVIRWDRFFNIGPRRHGQLQRSRDIDTKIASGLHNLNPHTVNIFSLAMAPTGKKQVDRNCEVEGKFVLPVRTLWRGARMGLPSGQDVARAYKLDPIKPDDIAVGPHAAILTANNFHTDTPLWYYILREADLLGRRGKHQRLGPIGSRIVGDVITTALCTDAQSFLCLNPAWKPPFKSPIPSNKERITDTAAALLYFIFKIPKS
jgi:hypothetical protein